MCRDQQECRAQPGSCTIGCERIQRLVLVNATISASMGSWLNIAARRVVNRRSASMWASVTETTWPLTMATSAMY